MVVIDATNESIAGRRALVRLHVRLEEVNRLGWAKGRRGWWWDHLRRPGRPYAS